MFRLTPQQKLPWLMETKLEHKTTANNKSYNKKIQKKMKGTSKSRNDWKFMQKWKNSKNSRTSTEEKKWGKMGILSTLIMVSAEI